MAACRLRRQRCGRCSPRAGTAISPEYAQLISHCAELTTCQYNYTPPLHFAVREGHLPVVKALVAEKGIDPSYKSYPFGDSFLTMAQDRGNDDVALFLQDALARPELIRKWKDTGEIDYGQDEGQRKFDRAVHEGNLHDVERLLGDRPELASNEMSSWAEGVLMMPAKSRNRPLLELLMRSGARVPALSKWGRFYYFVHDDIAAFLLESGMSARHMSWQRVTLLHDMAQSGDITKALLLIDHGADVNAVDDEYRTTPLGMAARWGRRDMVACLLERGADPNRSGASWIRRWRGRKRRGMAGLPTICWRQARWTVES